MTRLEQAKDPNTSPETLVEIIGEEDVSRPTLTSDAAWRACRHPKLPVSVMEGIARYGSRWLRYDLCVNPNLSDTVFELLRQDEEMWGNLVLNPNAPLHFLVTAARSSNITARSNVARCTRTPLSILMELVHDPEISVRVNLSLNKNIPPSIAWMLAADDDEAVRAHVVYNPQMPVQLRMQLAQTEQNKTVLDWMAHCPLTPLGVKLWLQSGRYGGMTLDEFWEASGGQSMTHGLLYRRNASVPLYTGDI